MSFLEAIKKKFKGEVDVSNEARDRCSRDASLFRVLPKAVLFPKDAEDIKCLIRVASDARGRGEIVALTARSAGTDMSGGPLTESYVVEFTKYFNKLKILGDDYAIVEPGMYYRDFEKETLKKNLLMPSYPASKDLCTVGGMVSNNSGGEKTLSYGKTERYVKKLKVILSDGNEYSVAPLSLRDLASKMHQTDFEGTIYKKIYELVDTNFDVIKKAKPNVTKNSSGYALWNIFDRKDGIFDLTQLFTGSQGTLGFVTEITFKLIKPKPASRLLVVFLNDLETLGAITTMILKHNPESFESYDDHTFSLAIKFFPEIASRMKGRLIKLALALIPEFLLLVRGGIPKLVLLAEFTGETEEEAKQKADMTANEIKKNKLARRVRVTNSNEETEQFWLIRRESFSLLRKHMRGLRTAPFIDDFSVRSELLPTFLPRLYLILKKYKLIYTIAGHVGDGNFHIIPLMDLSDPKTKDIIINLSHEVYTLVLSVHGSITAEHNDGLIRSPLLKEEFGNEVYRLFEETKKIFDPLDIFNPGKKVNASWDFAMTHLDTTK